MQPLTLDDLLPLEEYVGQRGEFFQSHQRYIDRYRRVRLGPLLTLIFENRQTLWFRVQEMLRVMRLTDPKQIQRVLDWYNRLLPRVHCLQAAFLIGVMEGPNMLAELNTWKQLTGEMIQLRIADQTIAGRFLTHRPEDRSIGAAHWVEFPIREEQQNLLADLRKTARFVVDYPFYQHETAPLPEDIRQSLLDDLVLSLQHVH